VVQTSKILQSLKDNKNNSSISNSIEVPSQKLIPALNLKETTQIVGTIPYYEDQSREYPLLPSGEPDSGERVVKLPGSKKTPMSTSGRLQESGRQNLLQNAMLQEFNNRKSAVIQPIQTRQSQSRPE